MKYSLIKGLYRIEAFDQAKEECEAFIRNAIETMPTKKARTEIRKKLDQISNLRREGTKAIAGDFQAQCKELETMLTEADKRLTDIIAAQDPKPETPKAKTLICKVSNEETLQKAVEFLKNLGLTVTVKD